MAGIKPRAFQTLLDGRSMLLRARGEGTNPLGRRRKAAKIFAGGTIQEESGGKRVVQMESLQPLISIAIPTYNRGALLEMAVASILAQIRGREDVEVVVYDTGSLDDTNVRMARLAREHQALRVFALPRRQSLDETLLLLLEECRGEYIWFFSSDDQMKPGALEAVRRRILDAGERPALVYVNQEIVDESGEILIASQVGKSRDRDFRDGRKILPWLALNLGFISASAIRRESALRATSAHEFMGTRSLNLHLYLRCLLDGGAALYVGKPLVRARRASGAPPYEYADVFVRDIVRILDDARKRGFGRFTIYRAMHRIIAGQYLRLVISWRADDPVELARTFPAMARACWKYPAFWLLLLPARLAPAEVLRRVRNELRGWRRVRNQRRHRREAEHTRVVKSAALPTASNFRAPFRALIAARKLIFGSGTSGFFKAVPFMVTAYREAYGYLRPKQIIETDFQGHKLFLDMTDLVVARSLVTSGAWEKYETKIFTGVLKKGMVVVDVGANIGHYTLEAARAVGETGKVFSFEPEPHNFSLLNRNVEANHYRNVVLERRALSNRSGEARLALSPNNLGGHHLANSAEEGEAVVVSMVTLDEYLRDEPRGIDLIKIDAEGAEAGILEGMKGTLVANPDVILFVEFYPRAILEAGHNPEKFLGTLKECGFQLGILDQNHERIEAFPDVTPSEFAESLLRADHGKFYVDLLCVRGMAVEGPFGPESWWRERVFAQAASAR